MKLSKVFRIEDDIFNRFRMYEVIWASYTSLTLSSCSPTEFISRYRDKDRLTREKES